MCSRETNRLPAAEIAEILGCKAMLPLELRDPVTSLKPSEKFFVSYYHEWEMWRDADTERIDGGANFFLVEVSGTQEEILDYGQSGQIILHGAGYQRIEIFGNKLGHFEFFCPLDEAQFRGRLKPCRSLESPVQLRFHVEDMVKWNENFPPARLSSMKARYGDGPFRVVGVRLHFPDVQRYTAHPEELTIEIIENERVQMSGAWFTK